MKEITKRFIVTRDGPECSSSEHWVNRWRLDARLKKGKGSWYSVNSGRNIDKMSIKKFKEQFGFTPRMGSKGTVIMTIQYL